MQAEAPAEENEIIAIVVIIMRFTRDKRNHLKQLVIDCITYGLKGREALQYIERRFGTTITQRYFEMVRKQVQSESEIQGWFDHFAKEAL